MTNLFCATMVLTWSFVFVAWEQRMVWLNKGTTEGHGFFQLSDRKKWRKMFVSMQKEDRATNCGSCI